LPEQPPLVSIIIPIRDQVQLLQNCVATLQSHTSYPAFEMIIVDNGSTGAETREVLAALQKQTDVRVVRDEGDFNFSRLNNLGSRHARGELLLFLNNDIETTHSGWLAEMVSHAIQPQVGAVGARLWYADGTLQHGSVILGLGGVAGHAHPRIPRGHPGYFNRAWLQHQCGAVTAACALVKRDVFERVGGFDERNLAINFNDTDLCLRIRSLGLQIVWTPYADLIHHESVSRGHHAARTQQAQFFREATYMQQRWGRELLHDPFYSPNLSLTLPGYELAFPPRTVGSSS
jgi:GT2 family glycosyltransferase